ncbi:MAG TPA: hypothetical protein DDW49_02050 [Deltaproteobacteria bacterium]|nr:MAG: hypothetical protein A2048_10010 [Deltaproteobacteria bacterium GWA2_45_12]HBF12167.1 hypothetical protein [Deltaproteobacteria bacterium]
METILKEVFVLPDKDDKNKSWSRIGVAFVNKDDSLNVVLDAVPLTGRLHIRDRRSKNESPYKKGDRS